MTFLMYISFGLADSHLALEEEWSPQSEGDIDRGGETTVRQITARAELVGELGDVGR